MLARLFLHRATRFVHPPSGPGIRRIWSPSSRASLSLFPLRQGLAADSGIGGGTSELPGPETILGRIFKLEKDFAGVNATTKVLSKSQGHLEQFHERMDRYIMWMIAGGLGTVLTGTGVAVFKIYYYDVTQEKRMRTHIEDVKVNVMSRIESSEKVTMSRIESLEKVTMSRFGNLESRLERVESRLERVESRLEGVESKLDTVIAKLDRSYWYW
ncbi:hypothetical protein HOY80DRAFT_1045871 [Tuber brumale]|nr:hypothetical protein HOY80DRAFT_1045871 [Tuber brumale]